MTEKKTTRKRASKKTTPETVDLGRLDMSMAGSVPLVGEQLLGPDTLGFYSERHESPKPATSQSAGMDIRASIESGGSTVGFNSRNEQVFRQHRDRVDSGKSYVYLEPGDRVLISTGIYANIPEDYYLAIHARSGTSWKQGLILTNGVAVIDSDYVDEIKVSLTNVSGVRVAIEDGERIAQFVLMPVLPILVDTLSDKPKAKTERKGGFGSTGK